MTRIAIFASGNGSNAENLIRNLTHGRVVLLLCNNPQAYVLQRAKRLHIPTVLFSKEELEDPSHKYSVLKLLKTHKIDFIILAGFLWKIPEDMIRAWPEKIVNIHPALLPKYGDRACTATVSIKPSWKTVKRNRHNHPHCGPPIRSRTHHLSGILSDIQLGHTQDHCPENTFSGATPFPESSG